MPINISRKKLSTQQGQQGVIAAIDMEKTLDTGVDNFSGDPSLRVLLVDEIDKFPFTDELFDISVRIHNRAYEDSNAQSTWLTAHAKLVKDPGVIARYFNRYSYELGDSIKAIDRGILKRACWLMSANTLDTLIDKAFAQKVMEPMYLAAEIKNEDANDCSVELHMQEAVKLWGKSNRQVFPGLVHMVNTRILKKMESNVTRDVTEVWEYLSKYYVRTCAGLSVTITLRNPMAYKAPVVLNSLLDKEET